MSSRLDELNAEIDALKDKLTDAQVERAFLLSPFQVGDVIENNKSNFKRGVYRVTNVTPGTYGRLAIYAVKIKKDGADGQITEIHFPAEYVKVEPV